MCSSPETFLPSAHAFNKGNEMTKENDAIDFTGFDIKKESIALAWDKMKAKFELDIACAHVMNSLRH